MTMNQTIKQTTHHFSQLSDWLQDKLTVSADKKYIHRRLEENIDYRSVAIEQLKALIDKVQEDIIYYFRCVLDDPLDPFDDSDEGLLNLRLNQDYRLNQLHLQTLKGYFGEMFAGIIAENFSPFGINWEVPAFIFRFHKTAFEQLERNSQTRETSGQISGRTGEDYVAFHRDSQGKIVYSLFCEAKCTATHQIGMIEEAHKKASSSHSSPDNIMQIIEIVKSYKDENSCQWFKSLQQFYLQLKLPKTPEPHYKRYDLVSYICGLPPVKDITTIIPVDKPHNNYKAQRELESVEIHLHDVDGLIEEVYQKYDHIEKIKNNSISNLAEVWTKVLSFVQPNNVKIEIEKYCDLLAFDGETALIGINSLSVYRSIQRRETNIKEAFSKSGVFQAQTDKKVSIKLITERTREDQDSPISQPNSETLALVSQLQQKLAGDTLQPAFAKLYSQHTRLRSGRYGLQGWRENEASQRLDDVMQLIEVAFIQKEAKNEIEWIKAMQRAAELLEWLCHPQLNPEKLPIRLLAAAAYQLAGYPARASGLLKDDETESIESEILRSLLKADFPNLLQNLSQYWASKLLSSVQRQEDFYDNSDSFSEEVHQIIVRETASALGILCFNMRWGDEPRLRKAIDKLSNIGKVLLHGDNSYSWLLAKLCAEVAKVYIESSMRHHLEILYPNLNELGKGVFERYLRQSYRTCKTLAWASQIKGIERLEKLDSFALCTPTGSGKTTVADLAILQSLFLESNNSDSLNINAPLVIYLVPTKALATEVESKLSSVLNSINTNNPRVIVTGLYGGTDWGPTDTWLNSDQPTILICTYEKAEALMKFLGTPFLKRVSLVIIDEAHQVQFDGNTDTLQKSENRSLRLESLGTRLFTYLSRNPNNRIIALSAVASELEGALASWITGQLNASPAKTYYRSTRQLIGRLECLPGRGFKICYDLLDGANLEFDESEEEDDPKTPFIPNPFSTNYPAAGKLENDKSPEKQLRPYLFWAAMNLAAPDHQGQQRAVLISITQKIEGYAEDFLYLLNGEWTNVNKPLFFEEPSDPQKLAIWQKCLASCEDYFGIQSREYQLLQKGVVVHHGKMPGLMSRLLIKVIDKRIVHLVLATSTLSEGVNLPFETVLIPSLQRYSGNLSLREFNNLVGRAGRPGFGTEGRSLVLLHKAPPPTGEITKQTRQIREKRKQYFSLIRQLQVKNTNSENANAISPLATLIIHIKEKWREICHANSQEEFLNWLENTAPITDDFNQAVETLDSLDSFLLSLIVEIEQIESKDINPDELEEQLKQIWQRSFAFYATQEERILEDIFIRRGKTLKTTIYQDVSQRRRLYRTSLPPRTGNQLLNLYPSIKEHLITGENYHNWSSNEKLNYIQKIIENLSHINKFALKEVKPKSTKNPITWYEILHWWLNSSDAPKQPTEKQVANWHKYVSENFQYRFNWGLGSIIALAFDEAFDGELVESSLEDWPKTGLPWIVFWIKELMVWGTLDPIAAYLLARVDEVTTRPQAEKIAQTYYELETVQIQHPNERLNAQLIRDWVQKSFSKIAQKELIPKPPRRIPVHLLRDFGNVLNKEWKVIPVEVDQEIYWLDLAGFELAKCQKIDNWQYNYLNEYDFTLDCSQNIIFSSKYL